MPQVTRNNFDATWLEPTQPAETYTKFSHIALREKQGVRPSIKAALAQAVIDHHLHYKIVARKLKKYGYSKTAAFLSSRLPRDHKTRMGNFGEVVSTEHLRQGCGYETPVFKLRFAENFGLPMRGEDIIAFRIDASGRIVRMCVGEAKASDAFHRDVVVRAHARLDKAYHPFPVSLSMIANILYDRGDDDLGEQVERIIERLATRPFPRDNWIFVITGSLPHDPFSAVEGGSKVVESLSCVDIHLSDLTSFVNDVFDQPLPR
jgi:hypothetical protein